MVAQHEADVAGKIGLERGREHRQPILVAFPERIVSHQDE
jgi:hypothetical protein